MVISNSPTLPLVVVAIGLLAVTSGCSEATSATAKKDPGKPVPVKTVSVSQEEVRRTTSQPATVHPYYRTEIRAKVGGYVGELKVDIGDYVEAGAVLAVIVAPEMQKQREIIEARIGRYQAEEGRAEAGVDLARANVRSAEAKLAQSKSELARADASLAAAESEFTRTSDLVERQSLQSRVLDEVRKKRDSQLASREAVASAINSAEADVAVASAREASAQADLKTALAETAIAQRELEELDVLIGYTTLKAPFAGVVTQRSVDPGDLVRKESEVGSGHPLFVISRTDRVRVHIPVPEVDAALISRGDAISLQFPSFPAEETLTAEVTRMAGDLDPSTRTMLVESEIDNPDRKLLPGMFGQAVITLSTTSATNMLPARAIRFSESGQAYVYIVDSDRRVSVQEVTTGLDTGHAIEIVSGLQPGQQVVDAHLKRFADGDRVAPLDD